MAQRISPLTPAIEQWLGHAEEENPCASLADKWMRTQCIVLTDLRVTAFRKDLESTRGYLLGVSFNSFGRDLGSFICAIQLGTSGVPVRISAPKSTSEVPAELESAVLTSLWKLAPTGTRLEVKLEDDITSDVSSLEIAERYIASGWHLDPAFTQLVSEEPRIWVFCFQKI
ncbi:MAG: hypothetical protein AAB337_01320 [Patescibacteria group bacterium]